MSESNGALANDIKTRAREKGDLLNNFRTGWPQKNRRQNGRNSKLRCESELKRETEMFQAGAVPTPTIRRALPTITWTDLYQNVMGVRQRTLEPGTEKRNEAQCRQTASRGIDDRGFKTKQDV